MHQRARCRTDASTRLVRSIRLPARSPATARSRSSMPTGAASASSSSALAADPVAQRRGGAEVERLDARRRAAPRCRGAAARPAPAPASDAPASTTRAKAAAAQPILVIHRRLVHEVGEVALAADGAVAEEHQVLRRARPRACVVAGQTCTSSQSPAGDDRDASDRVHQVEAGEVDDARMRAGRVARRARSSAITSRRATRRRTRGRRPRAPTPGSHDTCASSIRNGAALRTCQRISWSRSWTFGGIFSKRRSDTFAIVSGSTSATRCGAPPAFSSAALIVAVSAASVGDVRRVERRHDRRRRQRLGGVAGDHAVAACARRAPAP